MSGKISIGGCEDFCPRKPAMPTIRTTRKIKKAKLLLIIVSIIIIIFGIKLAISAHVWKSIAKDMTLNENSIVKDINELLRSATSVLSEEGKILFSSNYEKWSLDEILEIIDRALPEFTITERYAEMDVGYPWGKDKMKSFIIS